MTNREFLEMLGRDFPEAITALRKRWEENEPRGTDRWKRLKAIGHLSHLSGHYAQLSMGNADEDHGAALGFRAIMYLQTRNGHSQNGK